MLPLIADPLASTIPGGLAVAEDGGTPSLLSVVRAFKSSVTREWNRQCSSALQVWHRSFHDHVIRDEQALRNIREYIAWNPARWHLDHENHVRSAINPFYAWLEGQGRLKLP